MHTKETMDFEVHSSQGLPIRGNVHIPERIEDAPVLICCHGFKGFKDWGVFPPFMDAMAERGWVAIRFNFSLNGIGDDPLNFTELEHFKANTFSQELDDLETVIHAVVEKNIVPDGCDTRRIALVGHSRGGGIALVKAAENTHIRAVAGLASMYRFNRWGEKTKQDWQQRGYLEVLNTRTNQKMPLGVNLLEDAERNASRFDGGRALAAMQIPALLVHGEQDVTIPVQEMMAAYNQSHQERTEYHVIPKADHTFGVRHPFEGFTPEFNRALDIMHPWLEAHTRPL